MTITAYNVTDNNDVVDKNLGDIIATATVKPTAAIDRYTPTFIVDVNSALYNCNYVYCDTFNHYYYVSDIVVTPGQTMALTCVVDVLKSFAAYIKNVDATVLRSESIGKSTYIPDDKLPVNPVAVDLESLVFTGGAPLGITSSFLLQTMGGSGT